jgi:predicted NAD/FAD-binding protein
MKIAIVGSGISALAAAYLLNKAGREITVFESEGRIGGHTHTVPVTVPSGRYEVDTGFIVFNDWTYPEFIRLMTEIGVQWQDSSMSFSVKVQKNGLEYNGTSLNSLFAQRANLFRPSFYRMIRDILKFNRESISVLSEAHPDRNLTLGQYLEAHGYGSEFKEHYLIPMGAAIWSASKGQMLEFPIEFFVRFFKNHGMLSVDDRPVWKVIRGGSSRYLEPLTRPFQDKIRLSAQVVSLSRDQGKVVLQFQKEGALHEERFDQVVLACHSDEALRILKDANPREKEILGAFQYQPNEVLLHTDASVLPKKRLAWAAWNYFLPKENSGPVSVTYNMNILQGIQSPETFCVSLNTSSLIQPDRILRRFTYDHPIYSTAAFQAQKRWDEISGVNQVHFAGAYWGYGFHEDGVKSGIRAAKALGATW